MIELKGTSTKVVDKQEIANAFSNLDKAKTDQEREDFRNAVATLLSEDSETEVTIEVEADDIVDAAKAQCEESELEASVLDNLTDDDTIDWEFEKRDLAKPLLASNFNAYDFKRQMCDFFEIGYHVASFDLVKLFAEKLKVDYLL